MLSLLTAVDFTYANALAPTEQVTCQAQTISDREVRGRASQVVFPDGRIVAVVGHVHGLRQITQTFELADRGELQRMSNEQFTNYFYEILNRNRRPTVTVSGEVGHSPLADAQADYAYLAKVRRQGLSPAADSNSGEENYKQIKFVGYEGSERVWRQNLKDYALTMTVVKREFTRRRLRRPGLDLTQSELNQALFSATGGHVWHYIENPKLNSSLPMVGSEAQQIYSMVDSRDLLRRADEAFEKVLQADRAYAQGLRIEERNQQRSQPGVQNYINAIYELYFDVSSMRITSMKEFEERAKIVDQNILPWIDKPLKEMREQFRKRVKFNLFRDENSANALAKEGASGVHFVGDNHLVTTLRFLEQICRQELTQSAGLAPEPRARADSLAK